MLDESHFLHIRAEQIVPTLLFRLHCWMTLNLEKKREQSVLEASNTLDFQKNVLSQWKGQHLTFTGFKPLLPASAAWLHHMIKGRETKPTIHHSSSTLYCFISNLLKKLGSCSGFKIFNDSKGSRRNVPQLSAREKETCQYLPHRNSSRDHQTGTKCLLVNNQWQ